jgi:hypothetical protein
MLDSSNSMQQPSFPQQTKEDASRGRSGLFITGLFLVAILILSLIQNSNIITVLLLYLSIFLEGISLSVFVFSSAIGHEGRSHELQDWTTPKGADVVSNMQGYVSFAARGSEHSRREIGFIIKNLLEDGHYGNKEELEQDTQFQSDLERIVLRYTERHEKERTSKKESKQEREAYVNSLERIIQKLRNV